MNRFYFLSLAICPALACSDFDSPAQLSRPQIVGLRAEPPVLVPGVPVRLTGLVAGPMGPMPADFEWSSEPPTGVSMTVNASGTWLTAVPGALPTTFELSARVIANGVELLGVRTMEVGQETGENPSIEEVRVDGVVVARGATAMLTQGVPVEVDIAATSQNLEAGTVSWFATTGEFERYRVAPTEFEPLQREGAGWLVVVVRDGAGGIAWETRDLVVQ